MNIGVPSLEFMEFQNDSFFKDISDAVARIREHAEPTTKVVFESGLEAVVNKRLKTSVEFFIDGALYSNAYVELPKLDKGHPFFIEWKHFVSNDMGRLVANLDNLVRRTGTVNIEKAEVSGIFSAIPVRMCVTLGLLKSSASNQEVAAIILHELGHLFTYYYYALHGTIGGFISTAVATAAAGAKGDAERSVIYQKGARVMGIDNITISTMLQQTPEQNAELLQSLYINETADNLRSQTGHGMYEMKCCEQLADAFAVKFGAGLALTKGLLLINRGGRETFNKPLYYVSLALSLAGAIISLKSPLGIGSQMLLLLFSEDVYDGNYDTLPDRIRYIKNHLIDGLKKTDMPAEIRKSFLKDIEEIDKLSKGANYNPNLYQILRHVLFPSVRRKARSVSLQKTIEEMMYNETFIQAAKLKGATK